MGLQAAVADQVSLLNAGRPLEAFDRYFDDDGVMFDNDESFGSGKSACRAKQAPFIEAAMSIAGNITHVSVDVENAFCVLRNRSVFVDADGRRHQIDGIHWQRWSGGKIVEERYYRGDLMAEKIADGMLAS
jgi:hypothetical protein